MTKRHAILVDGGFAKHRLAKLHGLNSKRRVTAKHVLEVCEYVQADRRLRGSDLLRIYYYDAPPAGDTLENPIDKSQVDLATTPVNKDATKFLRDIENSENVAFRRGELVVHGWSLRKSALRGASDGTLAITAGDIAPRIEQKGVDLRIGLDIARISLARLADVIVVVTGDSDMVPAFKFARREGVRVYLEPLRSNFVRRELKVHSDATLDSFGLLSTRKGPPAPTSPASPDPDSAG